MKYFLGYLIEGDAAKWHIQTAKDISDKFDTWKIHEKIPPHITLYKPFDTENIGSIKNTVSEWTNNYSGNDSFKMDGFDHFGKKVIFTKIEVSESVMKNIAVFQKNIETQNVSPAKDYPSDWRPHSTLVNFIDDSNFDKIWQYVLTLPKPDFILPFNNITLFHSKGNREWEVGHYFPIKRS